MASFLTFGYCAFAITIAVDIIANVLEGHHRYDRRDTIINVSLGIFAASLSSLGRLFYVFLFSKLNQVALFKSPGPGWLWVPACFVLSELLFYLFHKFGHEIRFFWAAHSTHHSSGHFNFSTALRSPVQSFYRYLFWCPLALIGFDPMLILLCDAASLSYSFFLHTGWGGNTRWMELVLNTPSLHRVHHARNPRYIDKNLGGALIIFDRLFGTFQTEDEQPEYGITEPLRTDTAVHVAFDGYREVFKRAFEQGGTLQALRYLFGPTGNDATKGGTKAPGREDAVYFSAPSAIHVPLATLSDPPARGRRAAAAARHLLPEEGIVAG